MGRSPHLRIKPEHAPYRTVRGDVRIGGVIYGIGAEIADASGWVWTLLSHLDGTRHLEEVASQVATQHPEVSEWEVRRAVSQLANEGFLEHADGSAPLPDPPPEYGMSEREQKRYSRGTTLLRWMDRGLRDSCWEPQQRLREARVLMIGLGGTGCAAAPALVASGIGMLHCIDADVVEVSNLNRQLLYTEHDVGGSKVDATVSRLRSCNSDVLVTGERTRVSDIGDLYRLLEAPEAGAPYDLLLMCADDPPEMRRWANEACLSTHTPWVCGGYSGPLATAAVFSPGDGPCWVCLRMGEEERRDLGVAPAQDEPLASARIPWHPVNAVTAGLSGYFIAHAAQALLTGIPRLEPGFRYGANVALPGETVLERFPRRPDCPACGPGRVQAPIGATAAEAPAPAGTSRS